MSEVFNRVYDIVRSIPEGKVLTYGLISNLLEGRLSAQGVGWALNALPSAEIRESSKDGQTKSEKVARAANGTRGIKRTKGNSGTRAADSIRGAEEVGRTQGVNGAPGVKSCPGVKGSFEPYTSATVPWHRVINSKGLTSTHKRPDMPPHLQRKLLEAEGVIFDAEGKIDLKMYLFDLGLG